MEVKVPQLQGAQEGPEGTAVSRRSSPRSEFHLESILAHLYLQAATQTPALLLTAHAWTETLKEHRMTFTAKRYGKDSERASCHKTPKRGTRCRRAAIKTCSLLRGVFTLRSLQSAQDACKAGEGVCCPSKEDDRFMEKLDAEVHRVNRYLSRPQTCQHACMPWRKHQGQ